jgi:sugar/nucleoside kinase (ribokinase family)
MRSFPQKSFDVLGLGCVAVDDALYAPSFPVANRKTHIPRSERRCGGLTGAALVAAARLGARCAFAGCLGLDDSSDYVARNFAGEGVDISNAPRLPEGRVVRSVIVVGEDTGSRNIFYQNDGMIGAHPELPSAGFVQSARVLFIDQYGMEGNLRAARLARAAGAGVVADFEDDQLPLFPELLGLVNHLILSEEFALRLAGASTPSAAAAGLWSPGRDTVIVTCGAEGCWSVSAEKPVEARHHPAFKVKAADTTGCGDVFHGAYAAALARGDALDERVRFASAAAAVKATQAEIPRIAAVQKLLV